MGRGVADGFIRRAKNRQETIMLAKARHLVEWMTVLGALLLVAGTAAFAQSEPPAGDAHACTFRVNPSCTGGQPVIECGEVDTDRGTEQLVCCPAPALLIRRLCTGNPGGVNECGLVGPLGCSVCQPSSLYDQFCNVHTAADHVIGVARQQGHPAVVEVITP